MRRAARESNNPMKRICRPSAFSLARVDGALSQGSQHDARRRRGHAPSQPCRIGRAGRPRGVASQGPRHRVTGSCGDCLRPVVCVCSLRLLTRDQGDKGHVVVCGAGPVVTKTISCAELVKRRVLVCVYDACCWLDNNNNAHCLTTGPAPKHADIHGDSGRHVGAERRRPEGPQPVGRCVVSKHVCKVTTTWQDQHDQAHSGSLDPPLAHGT